MTSPLISIVTPTVQPISEFMQTAQSITSQDTSSKLLEWVVVVGRHFQEYENFIKSLETNIDIKLFFQEPSGIYSAMNKALEIATGEWVWFVNCGDYLVSDTCATFVADFLHDNPSYGLIATPVVYVTEDLDWFDLSIPKFVLKPSGVEAHVHHQGVLIRREIVAKNCINFDENLKFAADGKFLDSCARVTEFISLDKVLVAFRMGGASSKNFKKTLDETSTYRDKEFFTTSIRVKNYLREILLVMLRNRIFKFLFRPYIQRRHNNIRTSIKDW
jgi:glycosyltransferase involved in cell wall biosynthesis